MEACIWLNYALSFCFLVMKFISNNKMHLKVVIKSNKIKITYFLIFYFVYYDVQRN